MFACLCVYGMGPTIYSMISFGAELAMVMSTQPRTVNEHILSHMLDIRWHCKKSAYAFIDHVFGIVQGDCCMDSLFELPSNLLYKE